MKFITGNRKTGDPWNDNIVDTKKLQFQKYKINIVMELNIHGSIMIQFPIVTHHHSFSRKINEKISDIQIDAVQNFSRFNRIGK